MVKVAIFYEGTHDKQLLKLLIVHLELDLTRVKFFNMGSKTNFFKQDDNNYKGLQLDINREAVEKVLFMLDADSEESDSKYGGVVNTQKELELTVKALGFDTLSDIYVTCDPDTQCGYLESLILSTISNDHRDCIVTFLGCSDFKSKENHKAVLNQIYKLAYPNAPFDFSHANFDVLKQKLVNLFE